MTVYNLNEILPQGAGDLRQGFSGATDDRAFNAIDMSLNGGSIGAAHGVEAQWSEIGHNGAGAALLDQADQPAARLG